MSKKRALSSSHPFCTLFMPLWRSLPDLTDRCFFGKTGGKGCTLRDPVCPACPEKGRDSVRGKRGDRLKAAAPGWNTGNERPGQSHSEDAMNEVESTSADCKERGIFLWPSVVMLALSLWLWVFAYNGFIVILLWVVGFFFSAICLVCFLVLMVLRRPRGRSLS